jgi:hypothetical protein
MFVVLWIESFIDVDVSFKFDDKLICMYFKVFKQACVYIFALLTSNASDCHPNIGPITRRSVKYPSEICGKACKWSRTIRSIACTRL